MGDAYVLKSRGEEYTVEEMINSSQMKEIKMANLWQAGRLLYGPKFEEYIQDRRFTDAYAMRHIDFLNSDRLNNAIKRELMRDPLNFPEA